MFSGGQQRSGNRRSGRTQGTQGRPPYAQGGLPISPPYQNGVFQMPNQGFPTMGPRAGVSSLQGPFLPTPFQNNTPQTPSPGFPNAGSRQQAGGRPPVRPNTLMKAALAANANAPFAPGTPGVFSPSTPFVRPSNRSLPKRHPHSYGIAGNDGRPRLGLFIPKKGAGPQRMEVGPPPPPLDPNASVSSNVDLLTSDHDKQMASNQILMEQMTPFSAEWHDQDDWAKNKLRYYDKIIKAASEGWYRVVGGYRVMSTGPYLVSDELLREGRGGCFVGETDRGGPRGYCTGWKGPFYGNGINQHGLW